MLTRNDQETTDLRPISYSLFLLDLCAGLSLVEAAAWLRGSFTTSAFLPQQSSTNSSFSLLHPVAELVTSSFSSKEHRRHHQYHQNRCSHNGRRGDHGQ